MKPVPLGPLFNKLSIPVSQSEAINEFNIIAFNDPSLCSYFPISIIIFATYIKVKAVKIIKTQFSYMF